MKLQTKSLPSCRTARERAKCHQSPNQRGFTIQTVQKEMQENHIDMVSACLRKRLHVNIGKNGFDHQQTVFIVDSCLFGLDEHVDRTPFRRNIN